MLLLRRWCLEVDFFFQAEDGIRDRNVTGVQTCALPIYSRQGRTGGRGGGTARSEKRTEAHPGRASRKTDAGSRRRPEARRRRTGNAPVSTAALGTLHAILSQAAELGLIDGERAGAEKREGDLLDGFVFQREPPALEHGDFGGAFHGIPVDAATDGGKRDGSDPVRERELEAPPVAGGEQFRLAAFPAVPDRAEG